MCAMAATVATSHFTVIAPAAGHERSMGRYIYQRAPMR